MLVINQVQAKPLTQVNEMVKPELSGTDSGQPAYLECFKKQWIIQSQPVIYTVGVHRRVYSLNVFFLKTNLYSWLFSSFFGVNDKTRVPFTPSYFFSDGVIALLGRNCSEAGMV